MSAPKLTDAQAHMLQLLANGRKVLGLVSGLHDPIAMTLTRAGLCDYFGGSHAYAITPAGRAALAAHEAGK